MPKANHVIGNHAVNNKLLLVDDEPDIISIMKLGLESHGFIVDAYHDVKSALEQYKPSYYDRVITDIRMPQMNGFDFARRIWAIDPKADVCFLSSFDIHEEEAKKVFSNLKDHCFITKPITPSQLAKHIEEHSVT